MLVNLQVANHHNGVTEVVDVVALATEEDVVEASVEIVVEAVVLVVVEEGEEVVDEAAAAVEAMGVTTRVDTMIILKVAMEIVTDIVEVVATITVEVMEISHMVVKATITVVAVMADTVPLQVVEITTDTVDKVVIQIKEEVTGTEKERSRLPRLVVYHGLPYKNKDAGNELCGLVLVSIKGRIITYKIGLNILPSTYKAGRILYKFHVLMSIFLLFDLLSLFSGLLVNLSF